MSSELSSGTLKSDESEGSEKGSVNSVALSSGRSSLRSSHKSYVKTSAAEIQRRSNIKIASNNIKTNYNNMIKELATYSLAATNSNYVCNDMYMPQKSYLPTSVDIKKLQKIQRRAIQAAIDSKIFVIEAGTLPALRTALYKRGWVQKLSNHAMIQFNKIPQSTLIQHADKNNIYERILMTKLLNKHLPNFLWTHKIYNRKEFDNSRYYSKIIRGPPFNFARKIDLSAIYNQMYWFLPDVNQPITYPRGYAITDHNGERQAFIDDFNLTFCTSFVYYLATLPSIESAFSDDAPATTDCLNFAVSKVRVAIEKKMNNDIDALTDHDYTDVYPVYNKLFQDIMHSNLKMRQGSGRKISDLITEVKRYANLLLQYYPNVKNDGTRNIWILKPAACNRGTGIQLRNDLNQILKYLDDHKNRIYVVQKYLERPLLIYNTKFDIRQYFVIIMEEQALCVWVYKNCYLKFSGHEFNLVDLSERIHLTNHTVQKRYLNGVRSKELPTHNMWVLAEFRSFLRKTGRPKVWEDQIFPGIVNIIRTCVNASLDETVFEKNNFELYGADFMITDSCDPILLEINSVPDLSSSTVSTRIVCTAVLEDIVKILVDYAKDRSANTGDFELVARLDMPRIPPYNYDFEARGTPAPITQVPEKPPPPAPQPIKTPAIIATATGKPLSPPTKSLSTATNCYIPATNSLQKRKTMAKAQNKMKKKPRNKSSSATRANSAKSLFKISLNGRKTMGTDTESQKSSYSKNKVINNTVIRPIATKKHAAVSDSEKRGFKVTRVDNNVLPSSSSSLTRSVNTAPEVRTSNNRIASVKDSIKKIKQRRMPSNISLPQVQLEKIKHRSASSTDHDYRFRRVDVPPLRKNASNEEYVRRYSSKYVTRWGLPQSADF